ncbi:MAG TPA: hypothetical protein VGP33_06620 [Chloroflexota bacterium]|jgi:hypothetical protein|nr:hypothetical protein [Chloroflexota bacterium]
MAVTLLQEAAEAVNSALYQSDFEPLGNSEGGRIDWWHRGEKGGMRQMRVAVERSEVIPYLIVEAQWPAPQPDGGRARGTQRLTVPCDGSQPRDQVIDATVEVVVKLLELFGDILSGQAAMPPREEQEEVEL